MRPPIGRTAPFGIGFLIGLLGITGALLALLSRATGGAWTAPSWLPLAMASAGALVALAAVGVLAHAALRRDLARRERLVLVTAMVVVPLGILVYVTLGRERTRDVAQRLARWLFEPAARGAASP